MQMWRNLGSFLVSKIKYNKENIQLLKVVNNFLV